jgi:hypothetical protein
MTVRSYLVVAIAAPAAGGDFPQTVVLWRHGRVFSGLNGLGISRAKTIALARTQQRRIAAAVG